MPNDGGSLALAGAPAPNDAFVAAQLRKAGAVILGKTNLSEWANIRSSHSTSGWSGRGGLTRSPYALDRNPAVEFGHGRRRVRESLRGRGGHGNRWVVFVRRPQTVWRDETYGWTGQPQRHHSDSHSQDTAGPMARTVRDVRFFSSHGGRRSARFRDSGQSGKRITDYTKFLDPAGLKGAAWECAEIFRFQRCGRPAHGNTARRDQASRR